MQFSTFYTSIHPISNKNVTPQKHCWILIGRDQYPSNPKLYSQGVPYTFLSGVDRNFFPKLTRGLPKTSLVNHKTSKDFRSWPEVFRRFSGGRPKVFKSFPKFTRSLPKTSLVGPKKWEGSEVYPKVFVMTCNRHILSSLSILGLVFGHVSSFWGSNHFR